MGGGGDAVTCSFLFSCCQDFVLLAFSPALVRRDGRCSLRARSSHLSAAHASDLCLGRPHGLFTHHAARFFVFLFTPGPLSLLLLHAHTQPIQLKTP